MLHGILLERFEARKAKAEDIVNAGYVTPLGDRQYRVRSQSNGDDGYTVNLHTGQCDCFDSWGKTHLGSCKHRMACEMHEHEQQIQTMAQQRGISLARLAGELLLDIVMEEATARQILWYEAAVRLVKRQQAARSPEAAS